MISCFDDNQWPGRIRVTIRGGHDIWLTHEEAKTLAAQLVYIIDNPIPEMRKLDTHQLYARTT